MHKLNRDVGGYMDEKDYALPDYNVPDTPADSLRCSGFKWDRQFSLLLIAMVVVLVGFVLLLLHFRYSPAQIPEDAVWQYEKFLNGEASFTESMAPDQYWNYLSKKNDQSKAEAIENVKESAKDLYERPPLSSGKYDFQFEILNQKSVSSSECKSLIKALTKRGVDPDTVGTCKAFSVQITLVDYNDRSYKNTLELYAVQIGEYWYLLYLDHNNWYDYHFLVEDDYFCLHEIFPRLF